MSAPTLGSVLLGSSDPDRLREWYAAALGTESDELGMIELDGTALIPDQRDDVAISNPEPGRIILNFHVDDAHVAAARFDEIGATWLSRLEERDFGIVGTLIDPDGNYCQIIQTTVNGGASSSPLGLQGVFSGFAAPDLEAAASFYRDTIGLDLTADDGMLILHLPGGADVLVYVKPDHSPAPFTILNLEVSDIEAAVDELNNRGVTFERYDGFDQDERGIARGGGPAIAWFTDPAGNIVSVLQN